jgi:murein DD-endopeptidase MepM/ murein hydrolase activator NlpD
VVLLSPACLPATPSAASEDHALGVDGQPTASAAANLGPGPAARDWIWPTSGFRLVAPYVAPAHRYGPGHRGVDLALFGTRTVRSPAPGVVRFTGTVVDRDLITIDHGDGFVTTLEPVASPLRVGDRVDRGQHVGIVTEGGHAPRDAVHFGVRWHGEYINPMLLLGGVPRAILLPCCR